MLKTAMFRITHPKQAREALQKCYDARYVYFVIDLKSTKQPRSTFHVRSKYVFDIYSVVGDAIDVRILLSENTNVVNTRKPVDVYYANAEDEGVISNKSSKFVRANPVMTNVDDGSFNDQCDEGEDYTRRDFVVLGGTFDKLHNGHKVLLSEAAMRCTKKLLVGVTDNSMLKNKLLSELIDPCNVRIAQVEDFLKDIQPCLEYEVIPIFDVYGPTRDDPTFQLIVASEETMSGVGKINEARRAKGMPPLEVVAVSLLKNTDRQIRAEESKISSGNYRLRMLGTLLKTPQPKSHLPTFPYVIGLTGGIASGKSSIGELLKELGCACVHSDAIGHQIYEPGQPALPLIEACFGRRVINSDGSINRTKLGALVFSDKGKMNKLNEITWPLILREIKKEIANFSQSHKIVVIEAALLLTAGWETECHEIWSCFIPRDEAIKRIMERNEVMREQAEKMIASQPDNVEYISSSNVVFCTLWEKEFTKRQVDKAWKCLQGRIQCIKC